MGKPTKKQKEKRSIITSNHKVTKQFFYAQDDISLNFNLRVDIKEELEVFKKMLEQGIKDVDAELNRLSNL